MSQQMNILVLGATGKVGRSVVENLKDEANVNLIAAVRSDQQRQLFASQQVETVHFDFDDLASIQNAVVGIDSLLLLTGYTVDMIKHSKRVIDSAKKAGVKHIVHIGASGNATTEVAHWGWHQMIEAYIEQHGFSFTHIRPEAFMQNITAFGWFDGSTLSNLIGGAVWSWVDARDVAAIAAQALFKPQQFNGQVWELGYQSATMPEVALMLSTLLDREILVNDDDANVFYQNAVDAGADPAYMACIRDQFLMNKRNEIIDSGKVFDVEKFYSAVGRLPYKWNDYLTGEYEDLLNLAKAA